MCKSNFNTRLCYIHGVRYTLRVLYLRVFGSYSKNFGYLKVSLHVKEVLEVVKSIQTTALLITLFIHYFIISAVKETSIKVKLPCPL